MSAAQAGARLGLRGGGRSVCMPSTAPRGARQVMQPSKVPDDTMNEYHRTGAGWLALVWLTCALALASGCTHRSTHWQEDVQLSDGRVLTVDRSSAYQLRSQIGGPSGWVSVREELAFKDPTTGNKVQWKASHRHVAFLDFINGRFWLVASSGACYPDQRGQRLLQAYVLDGSEWMRVEPEHAPRITAPNMVRWPSLERSRQWEHVDRQMQREMLDAMGEDWKRPEFLTLDLINSPRC